MSKIGGFNQRWENQDPGPMKSLESYMDQGGSRKHESGHSIEATMNQGKERSHDGAGAAYRKSRDLFNG